MPSRRGFHSRTMANYLPVIPLGIFLGYDGVHPL
jgi:hypothetical protein